MLDSKRIHRNQVARSRYQGLISKRTKPPLALSLPQNESPEERDKRQYDLSLEQLHYNYMRSYPSLENIPVSAELPEHEMYNQRYEELLDESQSYISHNFQTILLKLIEKQLTDNIKNANLGAFRETGQLLQNESGLLDFFKDITKITATLPSLVQNAADHLSHYPNDIKKMISAFLKVQEQTQIEGPTAYLKSLIFDMIANDDGRDYLSAENMDDYKQLHQQLPTPLVLSIPHKPWMKTDSEAWDQDWFFGHLQTAGFNTTNLMGVTATETDHHMSVCLAALLKKMPFHDSAFQAEINDPSMTLERAAQLNRLYVVDYHMFHNYPAIEHHGRQRYIVAPIALFYWNPTPPPGYQQDASGVLQPVAIQCNQNHNPVENPIFTPTDSTNNYDNNRLKWKIAKFLVNTTNSIHHESIAHFGSTHLTVEPAILATHRQLSNRHPLNKLLMPHFRFNININDDARHKLIAPGGVIATNVGPTIHATLQAIAKARLNWRWDDNRPDKLFQLRAVTEHSLPQFAFRDDTMLLWKAIRSFTENYIRYYYKTDQDVINDNELQNWIHEMTDPLYAHYQGMNGLVETGDPKRPYRIESVEYLTDIIAHLIYLAGPQHANVNYAQYPLMSFMPCIAGTIYHPAPTRNTVIEDDKDLIKWYPPLDVSLYTFSFEYLLSSIQYDKLGYYDANLRHPYFADPNIREIVCDFQDELALIEIEIRKRNKTRAYPYTFQLPSTIPNSISI